MIVVTGATGKLGNLIVKELASRLPSSELGVSVRDPAKAASLAERGIRVRQGNFADPQMLPYAFQGASILLPHLLKRASFWGRSSCRAPGCNRRCKK